jgi:cation diffusion facilitator family transporter
MPDRITLIKKASWIGIIGNAILAVSKIVVGFISGSLSVVADGTDSAGDVLISFMTLYVASLLIKPPNIKFPYGYGKAEPNATKALSFLIFFAGAQLAISSVKRLISGEIPEMPDKIAIVVIIISIIGKLLLAWYQLFTGKKTNSSMLIANAKNMQGDVVISASVLVGLIFVYILKIPILDTITALLVSIWIMRIAVRIFIDTNLELMDGNVEKRIYQRVFEIVEGIDGVKNPHRMRIRQVGHKLMVNIDIELDGDMSLKNAHTISHVVEKNIKCGLEQEVLDVIIHIEPYNDTTEEQQLGITRETLDEK